MVASEHRTARIPAEPRIAQVPCEDRTAKIAVGVAVAYGQPIREAGPVPTVLRPQISLNVLVCTNVGGLGVSGMTSMIQANLAGAPATSALHPVTHFIVHLS